MNFLRRLLLHHAGLKLLSLLIAFLLWATYTAEPRVEVGYDVPVEYVNIADHVDVAPDAPTRVHVRLRGRSLVLRQLVPADIVVRVDLTHLNAGEITYQPTARQLDLPLGVELVNITPSQLRILLKPRNP